MLPVPLKMTGIGNSYLAIKATPEAQAWFEQGLNLLHDFWDYESARAFEQGIRVDPNCAMCYWGLYQALMMRGAAPQSAYSEQALAERSAAEETRKDKAGQLYIEAAEAGDEAKAATPGARPGASKKIAILRQTCEATILPIR